MSKLYVFTWFVDNLTFMIINNNDNNIKELNVNQAHETRQKH